MPWWLPQDGAPACTTPGVIDVGPDWVHALLLFLLGRSDPHHDRTATYLGWIPKLSAPRPRSRGILRAMAGRFDAKAVVDARRREREEVAVRLGHESFGQYLVERHQLGGATMIEMRAETGLAALSIREGILEVEWVGPPAPQKWSHRQRGERAEVGPRRRIIATPEPMVTSGQAALQLGMPLSTLRRHIRNGRLPTWHTPGGHCRIRPTDVDVFRRTLVNGRAPVGNGGEGAVNG